MKLTEKQTNDFLLLIGQIFTHIRGLTNKNSSKESIEKANELADALHNIPHLISSDDFDYSKLLFEISLLPDDLKEVANKILETEINCSGRTITIEDLPEIGKEMKNEPLKFDERMSNLGELIHGIGNSIVDGKSQLGKLTKEDGKILQELGHALRIELKNQHDHADDFDECKKNGFNPNNSNHQFISEILFVFVGNEGFYSFKESIEWVEEKTNIKRV